MFKKHWFGVCVLKFLIICMLMIFSHSSMAYKAPEGYEQHDYEKMVYFLEQIHDGEKNGHKINVDYKAEDPSTWIGVEWSLGIPKQIKSISWFRKEVGGVLNVKGCNIEYIEVAECHKLLSIDCSMNGLESIIIDGCSSLGWLDCSNNRITNNLIIHACPELLRIDCSSSVITEKNAVLSINGCDNLEDFYCFGYQMQKLDVHNFANLRTLNCSGCGIKQLTLGALAQLQWLECYSNNIEKLDLRGCTALSYVFCSDNALEKLEIHSPDKLYKVHCSNNKLKELNFTGCNYLRELNCSSNNLDTLILEGCFALEKLLCNSVSSVSTNTLAEIELNLKDCRNLLVLKCANMGLTNLDLSNCIVLHTLMCDNNKLSRLNLDGCKYTLVDLSCKGNQFESLNLNGFNYLKNVNCENNKLKVLDLRNCISLENLSCSNNEISELSLNGHGHLDSVDVSNNGLFSLEIEGCTEIVSLNCSKNYIHSLDLTGCLMLEELICNDNDFEYLNGFDPAQCKNLKKLACENNFFLMSKLPLWTCTDKDKNYTYAPQKPICTHWIGITPNLIVSYSSEAEFNGHQTIFTWYNDKGKIVKPSAIGFGHFIFGESLIGEIVRCEMTNEFYAPLTIQTTLTRVNSLPFKVSLSLELQDLLVKVGETALFQLEVDGPVHQENLLYRWQVSLAGGNDWLDIDLESAKEYAIAEVLPVHNGNQYRCLIYDGEEQDSNLLLVSNTATLWVEQEYRIVFLQPQMTNRTEFTLGNDNCSMVIARIEGFLEGIDFLTIQIDGEEERSIRPREVIYYSLAASLPSGYHDISISLYGKNGELVETSQEFYWDNYTRGFGFGRMKFN